VLHNVAWETRARGGRYYTRSTRRNGRIYRQYVGTGPAAEFAALVDEQCRSDHAASRNQGMAVRQQFEELDRALSELDTVVEASARLALICSGFHQHHRGEWRRRRGQAQEDPG
jgi:hypothetical protein